jgi:hypothetical protein
LTCIALKESRPNLSVRKYINHLYFPTERIRIPFVEVIFFILEPPFLPLHIDIIKTIYPEPAWAFPFFTSCHNYILTIPALPLLCIIAAYSSGKKSRIFCSKKMFRVQSITLFAVSLKGSHFSIHNTTSFDSIGSTPCISFASSLLCSHHYYYYNNIVSSINRLR